MRCVLFVHTSLCMPRLEELYPCTHTRLEDIYLCNDGTLLSQFLLQLHINPVHAVVQLRPSMQHLKPDNQSKQMITPADDETTKIEKSTKQAKKQVYYILISYRLMQ